MQTGRLSLFGTVGTVRFFHNRCKFNSRQDFCLWYSNCCPIGVLWRSLRTWFVFVSFILICAAVSEGTKAINKYKISLSYQPLGKKESGKMSLSKRADLIFPVGQINSMLNNCPPLTYTRLVIYRNVIRFSWTSDHDRGCSVYDSCFGIRGLRNPRALWKGGQKYGHLQQ